MNDGLAGVMLLHLSRPAAAAHADILDGAAETGGLMALKVGQGDKHISVHHRPADLGRLHILAPHHGHLHIIGALQPVTDNDLAPGGKGGKPVFIGGVHMLQSILPPSHIKGVAIAEEGDASLTLHIVGHHFGIVGPQKSKVSRLSKVHLDTDKLVVQIHLAKPGPVDQPAQLLQLAGPPRNMEIGKINLGLAHVKDSFLFGPFRQRATSLV